MFDYAELLFKSCSYQRIHRIQNRMQSGENCQVARKQPCLLSFGYAAPRTSCIDLDHLPIFHRGTGSVAQVSNLYAVRGVSSPSRTTHTDWAVSGKARSRSLSVSAYPRWGKSDLSTIRRILRPVWPIQCKIPITGVRMQTFYWPMCPSLTYSQALP